MLLFLILFVVSHASVVSVPYTKGCVPVLIGDMQITLELNLTSSTLYIFSNQLYTTLRSSPTFDESTQMNIINIGGFVMIEPLELNEVDNTLGCQGSLPLGSYAPLWSSFNTVMLNAGRMSLGVPLPSNAINLTATGLQFESMDSISRVTLKLENYKSLFPLDSKQLIQTIVQPFSQDIDISRYYLEGSDNDVVVLGRSWLEFGTLFITRTGYGIDNALSYVPLENMLMLENIDNAMWIIMLIFLVTDIIWLLQRYEYAVNWISYDLHLHRPSESHMLVRMNNNGIFTFERAKDDNNEKDLGKKPTSQLFYPRVWTCEFGFRGGLTNHEFIFLTKIG